MLRKIFSYIVPIIVFQRKSDISKNLEVTYNNGKLVLDSKNANYSYGSLQRILRIGLQNIGFEKIKTMQNILVLGVAGGSVIKTLVDEIGFNEKIIGVDIDADVIAIANQFFGLNKIENLEIVIEDAFEFVLKTKLHYDLIIIDVFQDTKMPNFLFEKFFADRIGFLLNKNGFILFNTICLQKEDDFRNDKYASFFKKKEFAITKIPRIENHNELILIEKRSAEF